MSGEGQWVDVSQQESIAIVQLFAIPLAQLYNIKIERSGPYRPGFGKEPVKQRQIWECRDGFITWVLLAGQLGAKGNRALVEWMDSEGMADDFLKSQNWEGSDITLSTQDEQNRIEESVSKFFMSHTKSELYDGAQKRGIMLYPVCTIRDLVEDDSQIKAREFWTEIYHPDLNASIKYPGAFAKTHEASCGPLHPAPLIGEDNEDVYGELGLDKKKLIILKQAGII